MELQKAKKLIAEAKNIEILPGQDGLKENIANSLALFYTLKKLKKNVNLVVEEIPQELRFLTPSLSFLAFPKELVVSIPSQEAKISQVRYEKGSEKLKISLALDKGTIKKEKISFDFSRPKPELSIFIGQKERPEGSNGLPIVNVGDIKPGATLAETLIDLISEIDENLFDKNIANSLLTGLALATDNFQKQECGELTEFLTENGASKSEIVYNLYKIKAGPNILEILNS